MDFFERQKERKFSMIWRLWEIVKDFEQVTDLLKLTFNNKKN